MYTGKYIRNFKKSQLLKDSSASSVKNDKKNRYNLNIPAPSIEENSEAKNNNEINIIENNDLKESSKKLKNNKNINNAYNISKTLTTFRSMSKTDIKVKENDKEKEEEEGNAQSVNSSVINNPIKRRINFRERLNNSRKKRAFFNNNNENNNNSVINQGKEKGYINYIKKEENKNIFPKKEYSGETRKRRKIEIIKEKIEDDCNTNCEKEKNIKEENIGNEIKDTVKCKMCFQKMIHPKMCPKCQNISCEKCLYNWFLKEQNKECNYCKEPINFYEFISVPFMDTIVDFVEKVIYDRKKFSSSFQSINDYNIDNINEEILKNDNSNTLNDCCEIHNSEKIYYFCLNCNKGYCKTCFVFFGKEKDRHINHKIIEYSNYKKLNLPLLKQKEEEIDINIKNINNIVNQCNSYKQLYQFEQKTINDYISLIQKEYNKRMDEMIENINRKIEELSQSLEIYQKTKREIDEYYKKISVKSRITTNIQYLIDKIEKINHDENKFNELLIEPEENINLKVYKSKNEEFNYNDKYLNKTIKFGNDFEIIIDNKKSNYININLSILKDNKKHFYKVIIYFKNIQLNKIYGYLLDDLKEGKNYYLFGKIISLDENELSQIEIKSIIYDFYFE